VTPQQHIAAVFAPHPVPAAFRSTDGFGYTLDDEVYPFDDCMLVVSTEELAVWAGDDGAEKMAGTLHIWLRGSAGFLYGFWSHDGRPMLASPIVYLGDEGDGNSVVANNLAEFLGMMACGFSRLCPQGTEPGPAELRDEPESFFTLRGIEPLRDWQARMAAAIAVHPDVDAWVSAQLARA